MALNASQKAFDSKQYDEAVKQAVQLMPDDKQAAELLKQAEGQASFHQAMGAGQGALSRKNYAAAVKSFTEALRIQPSDGNAKNQLERADLALKGFEKQAKIEEWLKTSSNYLNVKNLDAAEKAFQSTKSLDPTNPEAAKGLADVSQARKSLEAEKKRHTDFNLAMSIGQKALDGMNYGEAIGFFKKALELTPGDKNVPYLLQKATTLKAGEDQARYWQLMKDGAEATRSKKYDVAGNAYSEALGTASLATGAGRPEGGT